MPLNDKYQPDVRQFVCTCLQFVVSQFLVCKHLVQHFHPVNPQFFLEVTQNRSVPFWAHPSLEPLSIAAERIEVDQAMATNSDGGHNVNVEAYHHLNTARNKFEDMGPGSEDDDSDGLIDTWEKGNSEKTCKEELEDYIRIIRDFCDGLEFQVKFEDPRFLRTLEKEGAGFIRLAQNCLSRERRFNSSRASSPSTWERTTTKALFYRSHPSPCHDNNGT
ncbi:hypothetical protein EDB92DRAFT_1821650 [Lactarius akahatsu]|uniref:SWIM-type domain-containing protein n=1 Tax=Lactarius akahatsu TaxID=416441 RepID=A0AAD4L7Q2_9AGAM|nr:hypothetical protein EDB92DRAFT_1821650 [Lactarius akahatsu]